MHYPKYSKYALASLAALLLPVILFAQQTTQPSQDETVQAISVLTSAADVFDKAMACRQLSLHGDPRAVPALSTLLSDRKLGNYARTALETTPGQEASTALREAIPELQGDLLIGVLGSIGVRRDVAAIDAIVPLLGQDNQAVAEAAARTLGHLGTPSTADLLRKRLSEATPKFRPAVGNACLICAQRLAEQGEREQAVALCDAVQDSDVPEHIRAAAAYNAIQLLGNDALPRLIEALNSGRESHFRIALKAARDLGVDASAEIVAQFAKHPPEQQALLLVALGDIGNQTALPTVVEAAKNGKPNVRIQAVRTLAKLGDAAVVPVLVKAVTDSDSSVADAARAAIAALQGSQVNAAVIAMLNSAEASIVVSAIDITSQRNIPSATPTLLRLARDEVMTTRRAAIRALAQTATLDHLPELIDLTLETLRLEDASMVQKTLVAACGRMPPEECAQTLANAMTDLPPEAKVALLEPLVAVGGTRALQTVVTAAKSNNEVMEDAATRILGKWLTADAAPELLDLTQTLSHGKYKTRTLRAYIRIARQLNMTNDERMEVCRNAIALANRDAEKELVLEVLQRYPTPTGLQLAQAMLQDKRVKEIAQSTIASISSGLEAPDADTTVPPFARENMTLRDRVAECRNAVIFPQSEEERRHAFETLRQYPAPEGLAFAVTLLSHKMYEQQASTTIVSIASKVAMKDRQKSQRALQQVLHMTTNVKLRQAAEQQLALIQASDTQPRAAAD